MSDNFPEFLSYLADPVLNEFKITSFNLVFVNISDEDFNKVNDLLKTLIDEKRIPECELTVYTEDDSYYECDVK